MHTYIYASSYKWHDDLSMHICINAYMYIFIYSHECNSVYIHRLISGMIIHQCICVKMYRCIHVYMHMNAHEYI